MSAERLLTTAEAGALVGRSRRTISRWIKSGRLPVADAGTGYGPGQGYRVRAADVHAAAAAAEPDSPGAALVAKRWRRAS